MKDKLNKSKIDIFNLNEIYPWKWNDYLILIENIISEDENNFKALINAIQLDFIYKLLGYYNLI